MINLNDSFLPIISPFISILFCFGLHFLGFLIIKILKIKKYISLVSNYNFQCSLIGIIFSSYIFYFIIINNIFNFLTIKILSLIIIILGLIFLIKEFKKANIIKFNKFKFEYYSITVIIFFYFLISIGPITSADSLDYHIGVPYYIINNETYPDLKFWIHLTKAGAGEIFYTLPLINNAINLPGLTQLSSILSITGLLLNKSRINTFKQNYHLLLIFLSCPVLLFFVSSAKPQLIYVAGSALVFSLIFFGDKKQFKNINFLIFVLVILITNSIGKFSFSLSSGLLFLLILYFSFLEKNLLQLFIVSLSVSLIVLLSKAIYLSNTYDVNIFSSLISPLPLSLPGYKQLYASLTSCGYSGCFPYWLIFPKDIYSLTESLGIGGIIIFFIKFKNNSYLKIALLLFLLQILISSFFGPNNARWFFEPFIWALILMKYYGFKSTLIKKIFFLIGKFQSVFIFFILSYSIIFLTAGSFSQKLYDTVMTKNSDGYSLFKWSNSVLNKSDILISTHRSFTLSNVMTIPGDLFMYIDINNNENFTYYEEIKKIKPNFILFYNDKKNFDKFKNCIGKQVFYKKNVGSKGSRNPFNRDKIFYDGYLYEFKFKELPWCLIKN